MIAYYRLADKALGCILEESERMYPKETGGILIGRFEKEHISIDYATVPGSKAQHTRYRFRRNGDYSQEVLDKIVAESGGLVDYIGEWHSHPLKSAPSLKDMMAMRWIANNRRYAVRYPVMGLCMRDGAGIWQVRLYLYYRLSLSELTEVASSLDDG